MAAACSERRMDRKSVLERGAGKNCALQCMLTRHSMGTTSIGKEDIMEFVQQMVRGA